jgi:hypothetical protein
LREHASHRGFGLGLDLDVSLGVEPNRLSVRTLGALALVISASWLAVGADATSEATSDTTERLMAALDQAARRPPRAYTAKRSLKAGLTNKGEYGWMDVMTEFTPEHGLTYTVVAEGGSARVRSRALRNVLDREVEASRNAEARAAAFSTENYRYQLGGVLPNAVQIGLMPRREDPRLINGLATMDQRSAELSYVEGDLAKNPSFWVRDVRIARRYSKVGSISLPVDIRSTARVRMFGPAEMHMTISYLSIDGVPVIPDAQVTNPAPSPQSQSRPAAPSAPPALPLAPQNR